MTKNLKTEPEKSDPRKNALRENLKKRKKAVRTLSKEDQGEFSVRKTAIENK